MKKFKINLSILAMVMGATAALAFKAPAKQQATLYWFNTTSGGAPTTYSMSGPACEESTGDYCAKEYRDDQINFVGGQPSSVKSAQVNLQVAEAHRGI